MVGCNVSPLDSGSPSVIPRPSASASPAHFCALVFFQKNQLSLDVGFTSGLSIMFNWSTCLFVCQYQAVLCTIVFLWILKSGTVSPLKLFLFRVVLATLDPLQSTWILSISTKKAYGILIEILLNKEFEEIWHLNDTESSNPWTSLSRKLLFRSSFSQQYFVLFTSTKTFTSFSTSFVSYS